MDIRVDASYVRDTLVDLVQINSINPSLDPQSPGEREIAAYIAESMATAGLAVRLLEPEPGRSSAVAVLRGSGGGKALMLNAHIDTVGVAGMANPFSGAIRDGKLYGRGAYDMKGAMAACMAAAKALADAGVALRGDVVVAGVADEEFTSIGTSEVIRHFPVDAAIVTEPTHLRICLAHKGFIWLEVETIGRSAHGSRFEDGVDANLRMGRFLNELEKLEQRLRNGAAHPLVGPPSLHAATLNGGVGWSTYSPHCELGIERRTVPGETEASVLAEIEQIMGRLRAQDPSFKARVHPVCVRSAFEVDRQAEIVQVLAAAAQAELGAPPEFFGDTPWMDSALLAEAGIPTVVMGPAGAGAHADEEWVDLQSVEQLGNILVRAALAYCA